MLMTPSHLERTWYLLDTGGEPGGLVTIRKTVFPHPLEIRPDSLAPIGMSV